MAGNPYYVEPGNPDSSQMLAGIGGLLKQNREKKQAQSEQDEIMAAVNSNDPDKVADLMIKYPKRAKDVQSAANMKKGVTDNIMIGAYRKASADPQNGGAYLLEAADEVRAKGRDPKTLMEDADLYMEDPEAAANNARVTYAGLDPKGYKALQEQQGGGASEGAPSSVREWEYYNKLSGKDQTRFTNLKRQGYTVKDIGGVPTVVPLTPGEKTTPLSTLDAEAGGKAAIEGAKAEAVETVKGRQARLNELRTSTAGRRSSIKKAEKFLKMFKERNMSSGAGRKALSYFPGIWSDQGKLDEEFNAFAEIAARQALKSSGEIRPTDADVEGMKRAMFGIGRDESVNMQLLDDYLEQQSYDEEEYKSLRSGKNPVYRPAPQPSGSPQQVVQPETNPSNINDLVNKYAQ